MLETSAYRRPIAEMGIASKGVDGVHPLHQSPALVSVFGREKMMYRLYMCLRCLSTDLDVHGSL